MNYWEIIGFKSHDLLLPPDAARLYDGPLLMDRWADDTKPGAWRLDLVIKMDVREFMGDDYLKTPHAFAVMDDFGNLVRIQ